MKRFTVEEANSLLPRVGARLARLREELTALRFAQEQEEDLRRMWGQRIEDPSCADHADYQRYQGERALYENRAKDTLAELGEMGVEVKDPWTGLVDFYAERPHRPGEIVYLCWKEGEPRIGHWHPLQGGFAARKPIDEL